MNRKIMGVIFALLMVLAWSMEGEAATPVTVRVWTFLKPSGTTGREMALNKIITDFEATHPGIKVQVEPIPYQELPRQFAVAISAKNAPDIVWLEAVDSEVARRYLIKQIDGKSLAFNLIQEQKQAARRRARKTR